MSLRIAVNNQDHIQGSRNAAIQLVEYGDYQCGFCGAAYPEVKKIQHYLGDNVAFVFRNFPLDGHPNAFHAAVAAEVAGGFGKFWQMHDLLFENQMYLEDEYLIEYAQKLGIRSSEFEQHFSDEKYAQKVEYDVEGGLRSGVNGTPSFFINGAKYNGEYTADAMIAYMQSL